MWRSIVEPGRPQMTIWRMRIGSARRRDLYLTTHNTHKRQTSKSPAGFEPLIPSSERPHTHGSGGAATGISSSECVCILFLHRLCRKVRLGNAVQGFFLSAADRRFLDVSVFVPEHWYKETLRVRMWYFCSR
jgi:hypothetical protein